MIKKQKKVLPAINKEMKVLEIMTLFPASVEIMAEYGLHCFNCNLGGVETLTEGCAMHGFNEEMVDTLVEDLNEALTENPIRPQEITITEAAAKQIKKIAKKENHQAEGLMVTVDAAGGFCMEFKPKPDQDEKVFRNLKVPEVRVYADALTLSRIGGATIDYRKKRFKLDLE